MSVYVCVQFDCNKNNKSFNLNFVYKLSNTITTFLM